MNHKAKLRYAALERTHRAQIVDGLRTTGMAYREIARALGISLSKVEKCLGEAAELRCQGLTKKEIAAELGIPYGSVGRLLPAAHRRGLSGRQDLLLSVVSDMHGVQVDVLAELMRAELSTIYEFATLLIEQGQLHPLTRVQPGRAWVYPTPRTASRYLGWQAKDWTPPLTHANHYRAVAQARAMLVGSDPQRWVSERRLRHLATQAAAMSRQPALFSTGREPRQGRFHIHDGWFLQRVGRELQWWAVEVELTRKMPQAMDIALQGAIRAVRDAAQLGAADQLVGLLYLCRTATVQDGVWAAVNRLPAEIKAIDIAFKALDFDDEWSTYLSRRDRERATKRLTRNRLHIAKDAS
ncbi:hypothetical protein [Nocardia sp. XZ_19_385]|uniref:hypothetical protein n=1 Tax=Nocardia sp. XZ_19_385 TaxID=2769488 RepID=UPI00188FE1E8|nr:hypothetical protein [Nocardia sp. XZ_19_385]